MGKKVLALMVLLAARWAEVFACELCSRQQPEILEDITHGVGPQGTTDYIIVWVAVVCVGLTFVWSLLLLLFPKRPKRDHIMFLPLADNL